MRPRSGDRGHLSSSFVCPDMELDPIQQSVLVDWTRVCGAATKGFDVDLAGLSEVLVGDRREREQLDLVDLDRHGFAPVDAADLDLRPRPQPVRNRDGSVCHPIAKVKAELHRAILSPVPRGATGVMRQVVVSSHLLPQPMPIIGSPCRTRSSTA